jgi:phospholipase C
MADQALAALQKVKHIVVLMMENRSFDHMLGYLKNDGMPKVNGLDGDEFNLGPDGTEVPLKAFDADAHDVQRPGEALQKKLDPDHSKGEVAKQIGALVDGKAPMDGFVTSFVRTRKPQDKIGKDLWMVPMGHYTKKDLPTYDFLARNYCVCDAWHSSVPGDTWPNRLFSMAAQEGPKVDLGGVGVGPFSALKGAPIYNVPAFTRQLHDRQWRWYSHDPATLRAADGHYRDIFDIKRDNFTWYDRKRISVLTQLAEGAIVQRDSFLDDAAKGELRDVSWIDPNFIDLSVLDPSSNDDHPPSDIRAGQAFVLEVYEALRRSPVWNDTILVITYDEHGGFYDHQSPPVIEDPVYPTLGVRVPALVIGPRVKQQVSHQLFQHTSVINTILTRFADDPPKAIAAMPARVAASQHLGVLLQARPRTDIPAPDAAVTAIDDWRTAAREARRANPAASPRAKTAPSPAPDGAGQALVLHDFQEEFLKFAVTMRQAGLPPGQP